MSVRITLDGKAMEVLLGHMTEEQVIDLRNCVLNEFMKKRVKALVPNQLEDIAKTHVNQEIQKEIGKISNTWNECEVTLNKKFEEKLNNIVKNKIDKFKSELTSQIANKIIEELKNLDFDEAIEKYSAFYAKQELTKQVKEHMEKVLKKL